jgi:hypothetical protein
MRVPTPDGREGGDGEMRDVRVVAANVERQEEMHSLHGYFEFHYCQTVRIRQTEAIITLKRYFP